MGPLAQAETEVRAMVKGCSCAGGYRVAGLEYDTGGCLTYEGALRIARKASEIGIDEWRRRYAIFLDGTPKPRRSPSKETGQ